MLRIVHQKAECSDMTGTALTVPVTEMHNHFSRCLSMVMDSVEIIVTRNGKDVGRFLSKDTAGPYLTNSLTGVLKTDTDPGPSKKERLSEKYTLMG